LISLIGSPVINGNATKGVVRRDGRVIHDFYLFQVKRPDESTGAWDDYKLVRRIPAENAFRPIEAGGCPLAAR